MPSSPPHSVDHLDARLLMAASIGDSGEALRLIGLGAHLEAHTRNGERPLHRAARSGHLSLLNMLLKMGARIDEPDFDAQQTPLASGLRFPEITQALLKAGADFNTLDKAGCTPLMICSTQGLDESMTLLLQAGAPVDYAPLGLSALCYASCPENLACTQILLSHGANPNFIKPQSSHGDSILFTTAWLCRSSTACVEALIQAGAQLTEFEKQILSRMAIQGAPPIAPQQIGIQWLARHLLISSERADLDHQTRAPHDNHHALRTKSL